MCEGVGDSGDASNTGEGQVKPWIRKNLMELGPKKSLTFSAPKDRHRAIRKSACSTGTAHNRGFSVNRDGTTYKITRTF